MKKTIILAAISVLLFWTGATFKVFAQEEVAPATGKQLICNGSRDFSNFISLTLSPDGFLEYWKDIFVRYNNNVCQYEDIESLLRQMNQVREQIRKAFYACKDTKLLQKNYFRLEAEVYFLRHFINTGHGNFILVDQQKVFQKLQNYFVHSQNILSEEELTTMVKDLTKKYTSKIKTYQECKDQTWDSLVKKWNQFKESAVGLNPALKKAETSIEKKWDRMSNAPLNLGRDFITGFADISVNVLPAPLGLEQIGQKLLQNSPGGFTFQDIEVARSLASREHSEQQLESQYMLEYQTLYFETSDEFNKGVLERLTNLNTIIRDSYSFQNQTIQCVKSINDKQC